MSPARVMLIRSTRTYGGAERQIVGFAGRLNATRFAPVIVSFTDKLGEANPLLQTAARQGIQTAVIDASRGFDPRGLGSLGDLIDRLGIDMLCPQDYRANVYATVIGRRSGIPVVATVHGYAGNTRKVKLYELLDRFVLRWMDRVVCVSEALRTQISRWGIPGDRLHRVYNSIEIGTSQSDARKTTLGRTVCSVGRFSVEKGHRFLLDAWRAVLEHLPHVRLVLVGDGPEMGNLVRQASDLGIESSVEFAGHTDRPMDYLRACDLFVLPSLTEGLPVALLEAYAAGKPVVASDVGGVGEVVIPGRNGLLTRPGRHGELSDAIIGLLARPDSAARMGNRGRQIVAEKFSFERNVPLLEEIYLSCLNGCRAVAASTVS